jgi:hypothetical protein
LWEGVKQTFRLYCEQKAADIMDIAVLNGDLFGPQAMRDLDAACILNRHFLHGFAHLSLFKDRRITRRINYGYLDVEELGSVYESLLDYHPVFKEVDGKTKFDLAFGTERKSTGSYYTRPELVQELIKSALVPVVEERLEQAETVEAKEKELLSLKVCDPAAGSGHFLLAAARRIGTELAKVRSGEEQPTPSEFRKAVRDVIQHCIYGVDLNPLATDLCKVALWLEGHNRGYPLTFLDHRIKNGNSLVGLDTLDRLKEGIPNDAFKPVTGDDKEVAKQIKAQNRKELKAWQAGQLPLLSTIEEEFKEDLLSFAKEVNKIDSIEEREAGDVGKKQEEYERIRSGRRWHRDWTAANIWTAAFFYPLNDVADPAIPTQDRLVSFLANPGAAHGQLVGKANGLAAKLKFFHWPLEFPDVLDAGGFDVVLGNPPWERISLKEREFFVDYSDEIATEPNNKIRAKLIEELIETKPDIYHEYERAKQLALRTKKYLSSSGLYPSTGVGDINTYALFPEKFLKLQKEIGSSGVITQTQLVTEKTYSNFTKNLIENKRIRICYAFENERFLFAGAHHSTRFILLTIGRNINEFECATGIWLPEWLSDDRRVYTLNSNVVKKLNPDTYSIPQFRTNYDAELSKKIYKVVPPLKASDNFRKDITVSRIMHDKDDADVILYDRNTSEEMSLTPIIESKHIEQFNHRYSTYDNVPEELIKKGYPRVLSPEELEDSSISIIPRKWTSINDSPQRFRDYPRDWMLHIRNITNSIAIRTAICAITPKHPNTGSCTWIRNDAYSVGDYLYLLAVINSLVFDYLARQKVGGIHLNSYHLFQLPVPDFPSENELDIHSKIIEHSFELTYTSLDLISLADDYGYKEKPYIWNDERRVLLRAENDAYIANLYGLNRDELRYLLYPSDIFSDDYPSETFRVLKEKEIAKYGEYRTQRLVLEAWDRLFGN